MKHKYLSLLFMGLLCIFIITQISSTDIIGVDQNTGQISIAGNNPSDIIENYNNIGEVSENIFNKEWLDFSKLYSIPILGPLVKFISPFFTSISFIMGVESKLSWLYILTLILWIILIKDFTKIIFIINKPIKIKWISLVGTILILWLFKIPLLISQGIIFICQSVIAVIQEKVGLNVWYWEIILSIITMTLVLFIILLWEILATNICNKIKQHVDKQTIVNANKINKISGDLELQETYTEALGDIFKN